MTLSDLKYLSYLSGKKQVNSKKFINYMHLFDF